MASKNTTRYYSSKQEKSIAKAVGGRKTANSGAGMMRKGDVTTEQWLIEAKTKMEECDSMTVKREWIEKNRLEAFAMNKPHSAVVINFGDGENHYIISEKDFQRLLKYEREEE